MHGLGANLVEIADEQCLIVDPWNCLGAAQVFAYAPEVAALTAAT